METRISTLVENSPGEHRSLRSEHGISFLVERDGAKALFDLGQSDAFAYNARKLGADLSDIGLVALSHGHYDHSGGFRALAEIAKGAVLATGKGFFDGKYATDGVSYAYLGSDFNERFLAERGMRHEVVEREIVEILPGIFLLTRFPRVHPDETINPRFVVRRGGGMVPDDFSDEICMAVKIDKGFAILLGCSHPGMKNMLDAARERLPGPIVAVLGGTHLVEASPASLEASFAYLEKSGIAVIGVSHCTGSAAVEEFARRGVKGFFRNTTGHSLIL